MKLKSSPLKERGPQLFGLGSLIHYVTVYLCQEAQEMYMEAPSISSLLMIIARRGTKGKIKPISFLPIDSTGDRTRKRYANDARIIVFISRRAYSGKEMFRGLRMSEHLKRTVRSLLKCSEHDIVKFQKYMQYVHQSIHREGYQNHWGEGILSIGCDGSDERWEGRIRASAVQNRA